MRYLNALAVIGLISMHGAPAARCETADWSQPDLDTWVYINGGSPGTRPWGPSFTGGFSIDPQTNQFEPRTASDPARLGSALLAFETSDLITAGLSPSQYQIQSVTVTARIDDGTTGSLLYETTPPTPAGFLADFQGSGLDAQQPFELFGVGFREDYEGFALGENQTGQRFSEATFPHAGDGGSYVVFPTIGDELNPGEYIDVANNITGGFSETAPGNSTAPFEAIPWAIGEAGLNVGEVVPENTTFSFDLDLSLPGVEQYVQQGLADGVLGFIISSLHSTTQQGSDGAYPQWFLRESVTGPIPLPGGEAPTLEIEFTIGSGFPASDFDEDFDVDGGDFLAWQRGVANGDFTASDLTVWEQHYPMANSVAVTVVPEPASGVAVSSFLLLWFSRRRHRR